tara:strand:- start:19247 stop:20002 length:756 start_codon:yes stop_codon:yes gene_type:complete
MITNNESFKTSNSKLICNLIGGSTLYGLNNENSDVDYRGLFIATDKKNLTGFRTLESIVLTNEIDACYYELSKFLKLLRKSNTQVMEILFAPEKSFVYKHEFFDKLVENKWDLIDSEVLKSSLKGYVFSEIKLATGQRSGRLGGKRKDAVTKFGFSPKNFVQILRLCEVGKRFFETSEYMVKVSEFNPKLHERLMHIKNTPEEYTCEKLEGYVDAAFADLVEVMDKSTISYKFDEDLAAELVMEAREVFKE